MPKFVASPSVRTSQAKRLAFTSQTPFHRELGRRVAHHFAALGVSSYGNGANALKTGVIMSWFAISYTLFLSHIGPGWTLVPLAISTGLAVTGLGCCVQHDGGHGAYSRHRAMNRVMAAVLDMMGASSYVWRYKHNILHHTYTNVDGLDADINVQPFVRLAPQQPSYGFQRWQHLYVWLLYCLLAFKWHWWDDYQNLVQSRIGQYPFPRPRGLDMVTVVLGKFIFTAWAVVIPCALCGWRCALSYYVVAFATAGLTLACAFQLAHCVQHVRWAKLPDVDAAPVRLAFSEHQVASTMDFAPQNRWVTWYLGGLNFQVVHHLFPKICHVHYPALAVIVEETCQDFGLHYHTQPTLRGAMASHYHWLRTMGQPARPA